MKIVKDKHRLIVISKKAGKEQTDVFLDRRIGLAWPGPHNDGYFCLFGMLDLPTAGKDKPLVLLSEGREKDKGRLFDKIVVSGKKFHAAWILVDMSRRWETLEAAFLRHIKDRGVRHLRMFDVGSSFDAGVIQQRSRLKSLVIPVGTKLRTELQTITPQDLKTIDHVKPEERFPGLLALSNLIKSYELYPFQKPKSKHHRQQEGYR